MATLETTVKEMRHEHSKMKDNERTDKERTRAELAAFNNNMVALKEGVAQLNEAHNEMREKFRQETEELRNNEPSRVATFQGDFERSFDELRASLESLHTDQVSLKNEERMECTKLESWRNNSVQQRQL